MHQFDQDIATTPGDAGYYTGKISSNWSVNNVPNGGYLMAFTCFKDGMPPIVSVQTTFTARGLL